MAELAALFAFTTVFFIHRSWVNGRRANYYAQALREIAKGNITIRNCGSHWEFSVKEGLND